MLRKISFIGVSMVALTATPAAAQTSSDASVWRNSGTNNMASVQNGPSTNQNRSTVSQAGNSNAVIVEQVGLQNSSSVQQSGDFNTARHERTGDRNAAATAQEGNSHSSSAVQQGDDNAVAVVQANGHSNSSTVTQGVRADAATNALNSYRNTATVTQRGSDNVSTVRQGANSAAGLEIADNTAVIVQGVERLLSEGNLSTVAQESRGNFTEVFQFEGGSSALARNESSVTQQHRGAVNTADPTATTLSNNRASISMRGQGNLSSVAQNGRDNSAEVTMQSGGVGQDAQTGRRDGNESRLAQSGTDLALAFVVGNSSGTTGRANLSDVRQTGNMHRAVAWQRGDHDTLVVDQQNGGTTGTYSDGSSARAVADVSQRGLRNSATVTQTGDNTAVVTQGLGQLSSIGITQVDAGDLSTGTNPLDAANRQLNTVAAAQYGNSNRITVAQNALNASATVWQKTASSEGEVAVQQGTGATAAAEFASSFFRSTATAVAASARNLAADVTQGGGRNNAQVAQDGLNLVATVEQLGNGALGFSNSVRIGQQGSGNTASARQSAGVGPSSSGDASSGLAGDEFHFAGGARSAEITILQSSTGNSASAEQHGKGQVARIEQSGQDNVASIVQLELATNATAVIRQSGNENSYSVSQGEAGQYLSVNQIGNGNIVTDVIRRGPGS